MDVKWIKIVTDIFDDEKILLIESMPEHDSIIVIWFKLLCMAGKQNNGGVFMLNNKIAYTDEMLATIFHRPLSTVRLALNTFEAFGMIERIDNVVTVTNWKKHQSLDKFEKVKEQTKHRVAAHRERQKLIETTENDCNANSNVTVTLHERYSNANSNVTVTQCNALDIDKDRDRDRDKIIINKSASRFEIPTVEQVDNYCKERNNSVDAEHFVDYYTMNGWTTSKGKMKDWKAAVRVWEKNSFDDKKKTEAHVNTNNANDPLNGLL